MGVLLPSEDTCSKVEISSLCSVLANVNVFLLYHTICYVLQVTEEEKELQWKMPQIWDDLVLKSKNIDASLFAVKKKFKEVSITIFM